MMFSSRDALSILRQCPNLETCVLGVNRVHPTLGGPCYMAHLSRFSFVDVGVGAHFFQNLNLPNLRFLEYLGRYHQPQGQPLPFLCLISSAERLEHLHLKIPDLSTNALIEALRRAPALRGLTVFGEPPLPPNEDWFQARDDRLIPLLTPNSTDVTICPRLQSLTLFHFRGLSDAALLAFLLARTNPNLEASSRLSNIHVRFSRVQQVDIIPLLQERVDDGIKITLEYTPPPADDSYSIPQTFQPNNHDWAPISTSWASEPHLDW
ncbi:hypothetical protein C8R44DRAFT_823604 [Mycena epipterygia]|nr:hypothetical protein C8R44DRAFT_823604 [Mycena epipterygia]